MSKKKWNKKRAAQWVFLPHIKSHKYERGVVGICTGSSKYMGAALLSTQAAARSGVGMVRFYGKKDLARQVVAARPEIVTEDGIVHAYVVGSGIERWQEHAQAQMILTRRSNTPFILDAGALSYVFAQNAQAGTSILTPHHAELVALYKIRLGDKAPTLDEVSSQSQFWAKQAAHDFQSIVVLKGATSHIASPEGYALYVENKTHFMATAGTGDVLSGMIGAFIATYVARMSFARKQHSLQWHHSENKTFISADELVNLCASAVWVHAYAGGEAAQRGPIVAGDVIEALPQTLQMLFDI